MVDITKYPLIDDYETTLSQAWDGATWTVNLNSVPTFTFPSGVTTYIVVNPWKTNMQVAEINAIGTGTVTVNSITVEKGAGVDYTQQTHATWSIVRISNNYAFWSGVVTAVNSKVNTNIAGTFVWTYTNATARDAEITSPVNGKYQAYLTTEGERTDYVGGAWVSRASGTNPNASPTVAGKVEVATTAEFNAWEDTGATWALLVGLPSDIKAKNDLQDTAIGTNTTNIATNTTNISTNTWNITTAQWKQVQSILQTTRSTSAATGTVTIAHWLSVTPSWCEVKAVARTTTSVASYTESFSFGFSDWTTNNSTYTGTTDWGSSSDRTAWNNWTYSTYIIVWQGIGIVTQWSVITFDWTNVSIAWTKWLTWTEPTAVTIYMTILVHW